MTEHVIYAPENSVFALGRAKKENEGIGKGMNRKNPQNRSKPVSKSLSGLVPKNDVRLTANIRQDLHMRVKIKAAKDRTTIGEVVEQLIENHVEKFI